MGGPDLSWWCVDIKVAEVVKAVRHLKMQKAAVLDGIKPQHIKYCGDMLALYLSIAIKMFLRHSFVPHQFLSSVAFLIIKERCEDTTDVNNYRGIAISSVISKVLELVLLDRIESLLVTKEQQFGLKGKRSCADCSFVLKSAVDYYLKKGNDKVFVCTLDLSKVYDRVPYYNLFITLLDMGVPVNFVRLLSVWYEKQTMHVKWKTQLSDSLLLVTVSDKKVFFLCPSLIFILRIY